MQKFDNLRYVVIISCISLTFLRVNKIGSHSTHNDQTLSDRRTIVQRQYRLRSLIWRIASRYVTTAIGKQSRADRYGNILVQGIVDTRLNARVSPLTTSHRLRTLSRDWSAMLSVRDYRKCLHVDYFDRWVRGYRKESLLGVTRTWRNPRPGQPEEKSI